MTMDLSWRAFPNLRLGRLRPKKRPDSDAEVSDDEASAAFVQNMRGCCRGRGGRDQNGNYKAGLGRCRKPKNGTTRICSACGKSRFASEFPLGGEQLLHMVETAFGDARGGRQAAFQEAAPQAGFRNYRETSGTTYMTNL